jgi:RNA-binding protein YhbY
MKICSVFICVSLCVNLRIKSCGTIGKLAILYRRRDEDPEIEIP